MGKTREMTNRAKIIEKLVSVFLLGAFIVFVIPVWHPTSFIATTLLLFGITIIAYATGKFLSGDSDKIMLVVIALVVTAEALLFTLNPGGIA